jgi:hypothetical protein
MSENLLMWLIGGIGGLLWIELRGIRSSIEKLTVNDESHRARIGRLEEILSERPCVLHKNQHCER